MRRAGPDDRTVFHFAGPRLFPALIGLHEDLADLLAGFHDTGIHAAVHFIIPLTEEFVAGTKYLRICRFVDIPLLKLILCLFVEALHGREVGVPVPFGTGLLFNKADAGLHVLRGILNCLFILIAHGECQMEDRQIREAAGHIGRGHNGTITRHGGRDKAAAKMRKSINNKRTAFGGRYRAGIRRQTEGLHRVNVRNAGQLVNLGNEEHRHQLIRNTDQIREAGHDLSHRHLIEENNLFIQLFAVAVLPVTLGQKHQIFRHIAENIINHQMGHLQIAAAQAHRILIHKADTAHVGDHPAIPEGRIQRGNQVL